MDESELQTIISIGENYHTEFKQSIDKNLAREAVAFSNASGGKIFFGVADNGDIIGVDTSNKERSRIDDIISQIEPHISVSTEILNNVIILTIPEGKNKPYLCSDGCFIRIGSSSQKLGREDLLRFFQNEGRIYFDEIVNPSIDFNQILDINRLNNFIKTANISETIPYSDILVNLGCAVKDSSTLKPTNAGILFFSKNPSEIIKNAYVTCALYKGLDKAVILDRKDFTGNITENIENTMTYLIQHLDVRYEISKSRREEIPEIPTVALREIVINSVCHRDYFEKGSQIFVEIFDDRITVTNPGGIPNGITKERFGRVSLARNPLIASLLQRVQYIEKMGTGITRINDAMNNAGLKPAEFESDSFFSATLYRKAGSNSNVVDEYNISKLSKEIINVIQNNSKITVSDIAMAVNISKRTAEREIKNLQNKGILKRNGSKKSGEWIVNVDTVL